MPEIKRSTKGFLHRMLKIPVDVHIPFTLLQCIVDTPIDGICKNPTMTGEPFYHVTKLMKARANNALNFKRYHKAHPKMRK